MNASVIAAEFKYLFDIRACFFSVSMGLVVYKRIPLALQNAYTASLGYVPWTDILVGCDIGYLDDTVEVFEQQTVYVNAFAWGEFQSVIFGHAWDVHNDLSEAMRICVPSINESKAASCFQGMVC